MFRVKSFHIAFTAVSYAGLFYLHRPRAPAFVKPS
jgi:uncharacterized membrane protein